MSSITTSQENNGEILTCCLPLTPRWGEASVMKLTGSSPAIVGFWVPSSDSVSPWLCNSSSRGPFTVWVGAADAYKIPIACRANRPPSECPRKDILLRLGVRFTTNPICNKRHPKGRLALHSLNILCFYRHKPEICIFSKFSSKNSRFIGQILMIKCNFHLSKKASFKHKTNGNNIFLAKNSNIYNYFE